MCQKVARYLGYFCKKIFWQKLSKIVHSDPTDVDVGSRMQQSNGERKNEADLKQTQKIDKKESPPSHKAKTQIRNC